MPSLPICLGGNLLVVITPKSVWHYLGFYFDRHLSFKAHVEYLLWFFLISISYHWLIRSSYLFIISFQHMHQFLMQCLFISFIFYLHSISWYRTTYYSNPFHIITLYSIRFYIMIFYVFLSIYYSFYIFQLIYNGSSFSIKDM